jgi:arginase
VVGGDCPILLGCLAGAELTGESVGLMFVDGHEDAWSPALSRTGEAADMELGFILGLNHEGLPTDLSRSMPRLDGHAVAILGPRDQEELKEAGIPSLACRVALFHTARAVASHADALAISAARQLSRAGSWWLHVDLDVLSTESLSAVDYRQPGGLNWSDLRGLTEGALRSPAVVGWDITIYNPDLDVDGSGAEEIVAYVAAMLGKRQRWALAVRDDRRRTGPV